MSGILHGRHAEPLDLALDEHGPGEAEAAVFLSDGVSWRSYNDTGA
jgi:hypothetical protein